MKFGVKVLCKTLRLSCENRYGGSGAFLTVVDGSQRTLSILLCRFGLNSVSSYNTVEHNLRQWPTWYTRALFYNTFII